MPQNRAVSVLVHGLSKAGKTTVSSTAPKPLLYIDREGGSRFLRHRKVDWDPLTQAPPVCDGTWETAVVTVTTMEQVQYAYRWLASGQHCFQAVAVDSVSDLQQLLIEEISNRQQMQTQDWGTVLRDFSGLIRDFHQLTMHPTAPVTVVLIAASTEGRDGKLKPYVQGSSKDRLPYIVDILAAMEAVVTVDFTSGASSTTYRLHIGPNNRYETGERVGGTLPAYIDNPNVPLMLDYIFGVEPSAAVAPAPAAETPAPAGPTE